jgi:EF-P beta-lysylation protein EpmB
MATLLGRIGLDTTVLKTAVDGIATFPLKVTPGFVSRMKSHDPGDPLLRQVLPLAEEDINHAGFIADPLGEASHAEIPGVLHKYHGRALLITTGACAIHCRYCFRRHFPYADQIAAQKTWKPALAYLSEDTSVRELILSGGDPLSLDDAKLADLITRLDPIRHLQRLRIHTRMPVVLPQRITDTFLRTLAASRLKSIIVIHCNHPAEIDNEVMQALDRLQQAQIPVLNQSVLLRGVNDNAGVLAELSERLFACNVMPYYLHMLDPVAGAAHFDVPDDEATLIMQELRRLLPGYLVPRLVREVVGEPSKTQLY